MTPRIISISVRLYRWLLCLYPSDFRQEYGTEIEQVFQDCCRAAYQQGVSKLLVLWIAFAGDLLTNACAERWISTRRKMTKLKIIQSFIVFSFGVLALTSSYFVLFVLMAAMTEIYLVPWDTFGHPPLDTLAHTMNDFFEAGAGAVLPAWMMIITSFAILMLGIYHRYQHLTRLIYLFALTNVFGVVTIYLLSAASTWLTNVLLPFPQGRRDPGFHRSVLPILVITISTLYLLITQWRIALSNDEPKGKLPMLKRWFDVWTSVLGLWLFLPLLPIIALLIKLDSHGSIFFVQARVGKDGRAFSMVKLRSMADAPDGRKQITRVGHLLRWTRIDELPQLFNVLKGEMTIFGPRPVLPQEVNLKDDDRFISKPGLLATRQA